MTALHRVLVSTKKLLVIGGIFFLILLFSPLLFGFSKSLKESFFSTPPKPPTVEFGKVQKILFIQNKFQNEVTNTSYIIDTLSGTLPNLPDRVSVYKLMSNSPTLFSLQRAEKKVAKLGFPAKGISLSETLYQWNDQTTLKRKLVFDIISSHFDLTSSFLKDSTVLEKKPYLLNEQASNMSKALFNQLALPLDDIDQKKTKITNFSMVNNDLVPSISISDTDIIRVDFFQKDIDKLPIVYPNPPFSSTYTLIAGGDSNGQIVEAHYHHYSIDKTSATYPIITSSEAIAKLQNRKAYIASYNGIDTEIKIKDIFLSYYLGVEDQQMLLPIIVFQGTNGFFAYVPAVKNEWVQK
ncbi:MAG: hypothetical protein A3G13_01780 [Candidatus Levybacteria bacterium RIFCSPLOWO2_12_FULL_37_7]|nr:MAG: hypothetical protein A2770_02375 [Candidatus Levybacteria bacterium RIFCSPHIGHO2_01_FULL_38_12]OGH51763.1 MAG: hypothetical protein A3G13_01780 [Candidatus Levybacteria bacterium RIFCSPLOWO2_12_FULL_37_7]